MGNFVLPRCNVKGVASHITWQKFWKAFSLEQRIVPTREPVGATHQESLSMLVKEVWCYNVLFQRSRKLLTHRIRLLMIDTWNWLWGRRKLHEWYFCANITLTELSVTLIPESYSCNFFAPNLNFIFHHLCEVLQFFVVWAVHGSDWIVEGVVTNIVFILRGNQFDNPSRFVGSINPLSVPPSFFFFCKTSFKLRMNSQATCTGRLLYPCMQWHPGYTVKQTALIDSHIGQGIQTEFEVHIKKYDSTSYLTIGQVQTSRLYKTKQRSAKSLQTASVFYSNAKSTLNVQVGWENQTWKFWICYHLSSFFF